MIEIRHLVKRYGNHVAVDDLSFTVEEGQIYGFLGPNGAGKSTTMNIMTGYLGATSGEVIINGHNILEEPALAKKCIGYLPEIPPVYTDMTVYEYLRFAAELKEIPKEERQAQIDEVVTLTKLEDVYTRLIKNLSKGYRQRVGLAQAILGFPPIIILDEPTVGLDPKQIIEIRDLIRTLSKEHTIILSSHILQEVSAVCDYVMIISHGRLVASDTPQNLERMMSQTDVVYLETKADEETMENIIRGVAKDCQITFKKTSDDVHGCEVIFADGGDYREDLFFAFAKAGVAILAMKTSSVSLEDIFLELTADDSEDDMEIEDDDMNHSENDLNQDMDVMEEVDTEITEDIETTEKEENQHEGDL